MSSYRFLPDPTRRETLGLLMGAGVSLALPGRAAAAGDARAILKRAFDNWRADSSHAVTEMLVKHGSSRKMTLESWTKGDDKALVRVIAPARDAGNATLQLGNATYVFNPKLNQVIKLPASAMSQSWLGSDFSYDDLSRSQKVVDDFTHKLIGSETSGGKRVDVIESIPKPGKPIVWGKEIIRVRADGVLIGVEFYDQLGKRVRAMTADKVGVIGGRPYPVVLTMKTDAKPGQYTRVTTKSAEFNISIPAYMFTKSNLQNPR
ncbi:MAG TPA: outer membrane lipoprotein-sorting protein [Aliiroseovarius sp.]|nr:outer membrane lipoprotein-sorting protein [Aliiroseovarius sp.]